VSSERRYPTTMNLTIAAPPVRVATLFSGLCSFLDSLLGPRPCIVGDLLPPLLGRHEMRAYRELRELRARVRCVVLRVRALDGGRHQVIFAPRDDEKGRAGVIVVVDRDVLWAGDEIRQHAVPENGP